MAEKETAEIRATGGEYDPRVRARPGKHPPKTLYILSAMRGERVIDSFLQQQKVYKSKPC